VAGEWARRVEPGKTGSIPIRYTASYIGGEISKTVIVYCNDPAQTNVVLHINGMVWEPVDVTPAYVMFGANSDRETNETQVVRIVNNMPDPLEVSDPKCYDRLFQTAIKTVKPGREYELQITLTPPLTPGNYTVPITANTSSTNLSVINITAFAAVRPAVLATPSEIILPTQISSTGAVARIIVHNYGIKPLIVSGAEVNYPGVNVQVQESQPGREFVVRATFPPKLQIRLERPVEIQIKTSHPQFPVLKVPVHQNKSLSDLLESTPNPDSIKPPNKAKK
jgi:hypothetical protein